MELEPEGIVPPAAENEAGRDPVVARVEGLLDEERFEDALAACREALAAGEGNELDLLFLAGDASLSLGDAAEAEGYFRAVLATDPDCSASRSYLAKALFLQWRFDEAEVAVAAALDLADAPAEAHAVHGALLERRGRLAEAETCFRNANAMAPDAYPLPVRMARKEFDREVRQAVNRLPRQFRKALDRVPIEVHDIPPDALARHGDDEVLPDILGLFEGVPLTESEGLDVLATSSWQPNRILLFQRNIERMVFDREDLVEQIRITLWHEVAHYLGFEEEDMDDLGLA